LPLDGVLKQAILKREGELGAVLDAVLGYEAGNFGVASHHGFSIHRVQSAFWEAVAYSASMLAELKLVTGSSTR
jgi:c-di-GMP-related signal transduction protein